MEDYQKFLESKRHTIGNFGFKLYFSHDDMVFTILVNKNFNRHDFY